MAIQNFEAMEAYVFRKQIVCRAKTLEAAFDDVHGAPCGECDVCAGQQTWRDDLRAALDLVRWTHHIFAIVQARTIAAHAP